MNAMAQNGCFANDDDDLFTVYRETLFVGPQHVQHLGMIFNRMIPCKFRFESTGVMPLAAYKRLLC
jgi:hypothetical protein